MNNIRVGHGFDVHQLVAGRPLILGGVRIPFEKGLQGHSDADVLLHAICDALLGAAGLPDIGRHFPPSDPKWKDADSGELLVKVKSLVEAAGCEEIVNIDAIIMAEEPKIGPHVETMRARIGQLLGVSKDRIGLKATTCERLGFVGREEGIAASAVCLIIVHG
ncbi:MAG TPA: 2-C-methyl-D-erythritol 2,4-cyclodiphosphate synthase [Candidatus Acidoferrum sp.]|nr:2-C-methyl-D-erythritol 2,4-cyclodiphosphate synthase [Candidatus Acidoferrum sp.]